MLDDPHAREARVPCMASVVLRQPLPQAANPTADDHGPHCSGPQPWFARSRQAAQWLRQRQPGLIVNLKDVHPHLLYGLVDQMDRLLRAYPQLRPSVTALTVTDTLPQGVIACAQRGADGAVQLNLSAWRDAATLRRKVRRMARAGRTIPQAAPSPERFIVTHEFGHLVDEYLRRANSGAPDMLISLGFDAAISRYARQGAVEAFAEGFAQLELAGPGEQLPRYTLALRRLLDRYGFRRHT